MKEVRLEREKPIQQATEVAYWDGFCSSNGPVAQ